jgi:predicted nucleic-acid-binding Zn-ribbon protein
MKLTGDQFNKFFDTKKTGTYKCPVCSHEQFSLNGGGPDADLSLAALAASDPTLEKSSHAFYTMTCENCGHTIFFHQRVIENWMKSGKTENG